MYCFIPAFVSLVVMLGSRKLFFCFWSKLRVFHRIAQLKNGSSTTKYQQGHYRILKGHVKRPCNPSWYWYIHPGHNNIMQLRPRYKVDRNKVWDLIMYQLRNPLYCKCETVTILTVRSKHFKPSLKVPWPLLLLGFSYMFKTVQNQSIKTSVIRLPKQISPPKKVSYTKTCMLLAFFSYLYIYKFWESDGRYFSWLIPNCLMYIKAPKAKKSMEPLA